jgi:hypothetical protein
LGCSRTSRRVWGCKWQVSVAAALRYRPVATKYSRAQALAVHRHRMVAPTPAQTTPRCLLMPWGLATPLHRDLIRTLGGTVQQGPVCGEPLLVSRARPMAAQGTLWKAQNNVRPMAWRWRAVLGLSMAECLDHSRSYETSMQTLRHPRRLGFGFHVVRQRGWLQDRLALPRLRPRV